MFNAGQLPSSELCTVRLTVAASHSKSGRRVRLVDYAGSDSFQ